jgi:hypothetical protein
VRFVALGPDENVAGIAEQRARPRLVAEQHGIAAQIGPGEFDRLARVVEQGDDVAGRVMDAGFVGTAQEEHPSCAGRTRRDGSEILLGRLHCGSRICRASRVTIRSATTVARFSSAVFSAAIVAYSEPTTSMPASDPAVASTRMSPLARSTS